MATKVVLNRQALGRILKGQEGTLKKDLEARGERIAAAAGTGYESTGRVGRARYRVNVASTELVDVDSSPLRSALDAGKGG